MAGVDIEFHPAGIMVGVGGSRTMRMDPDTFDRATVTAGMPSAITAGGTERDAV
jgi:hypothetical protein